MKRWYQRNWFIYLGLAYPFLALFTRGLILNDKPMLIAAAIWLVLVAFWFQLNRPKIKRGTYTGDDGTNRAIPHGLGRTPKRVIIRPQNER